MLMCKFPNNMALIVCCFSRILFCVSKKKGKKQKTKTLLLRQKESPRPTNKYLKRWCNVKMYQYCEGAKYKVLRFLLRFLESFWIALSTKLAQHSISIISYYHKYVENRLITTKAKNSRIFQVPIHSDILRHLGTPHAPQNTQSIASKIHRY